MAAGVLRLDPVPVTGKAALRHLVRAYVRELQRVTGCYDPADEADPAAFDLETFDLYWTVPSRRPLLIRCDAAVAGFALLSRRSLTGRSTDWTIAEFFVRGPFRRSGIGSRAAAAIFAAEPGLWEVGVLAGNLPARVFWPPVIDRASGGVFEEIWDAEGPIFRFRAPGRPASPP